MTCAGCDGGLDGDVAVRTEADHAIPGSAGPRQEDGQKDGPCDNWSLPKTPHATAPISIAIDRRAKPSLVTCNDANGKATFCRPYENTPRMRTHGASVPGARFPAITFERAFRG